MKTLTEHDIQVIQEEEENLQRLRQQNNLQQVSDNREALLRQIFELRETLNDANEDDVAHITEQINQITHLVNQGDRSEIAGVDLNNPYFAHIRLEEEEITRDLYIGTQVFRSKNGKIQVIDWKSSPISMIYFRYDEGEDYEEQLGNRWIEGVVEFKRVLKIHNGELVQVQYGHNVLEKDKVQGWTKVDSLEHTLHGGSGTATRAEHSREGNPRLGSDETTATKGKFLPEITALIDDEQFKLITQPQSGVVAIQGTAGSGKTTVALHRVAWLHYQAPQRFQPEKMMVMVFNKALANYISKVLPSLGVKNVSIDFFENWASRIRNQIFGGSLPRRYAENTPVSVIRLKKHPALLTIINEYIREKEQLFESKIGQLLQSKQLKNFPLKAINKLPILERLYRIYDWANGKGAIKGKRYNFGGEVATVLQRIVGEFINRENSKKISLIQCWEELFSDFERIAKRFRELASGEITENILKDAISWQKHQYTILQDESGGEQKHFNEATLDYEDDPILLLMYQKMVGYLPKSNKKPLKYSHLMIDEAQDLSPLEMTVMMNVTEEPHSITLAGDVNQQMIQHNGFKNWDFMFDYLGLEGQELSNLKVSYRSTYEIMSFAMDVLGDQNENKEVKTVKHGPPVELFQFIHQGEMASFLANSLKEIMMIESNASIAVICISPESAESYYNLLEQMEIPRLRLVADQDFTFTAGIDITDIKQVKGLEFDYVILLDVDTVNYPENSYTRYLLHIGATRAAHQLWMVNYRVPSMLLPASITEQAVR